MSPLSIQLPEELRSQAEARAAEGGHGSVAEYVEALVRADLESEGIDDDIEALLLERLDSPEPGIEVTPAFWERLREECRARRDAGTSR